MFLTGHVKMQFALHVLSDLDPLELAGTCLFEVNYIITSWAIAIWVKPEPVSTQTIKGHFAQIL
jgi:hypothetical protein